MFPKKFIGLTLHVYQYDVIFDEYVSYANGHVLFLMNLDFFVVESSLFFFMIVNKRRQQKLENNPSFAKIV